MRVPAHARTRPPRSLPRAPADLLANAQQWRPGQCEWLPVNAAWRLYCSAGCLRRGQLPAPPTAPIRPPQNTPCVHLLTFPTSDGLFFFAFFFFLVSHIYIFCSTHLFEDSACIFRGSPRSRAFWHPTWRLMDICV